MAEQSGISHRSVAFDNLRGMAVLLVLIHHIQLVGQTFVPGTTWGALGVRIFFIISGYLVMHSFENNVQKYGSREGIKQYALNRFFRITPAYYFNLLMLILIAPLLLDTYPYVTTFAFLGDILMHLVFLGYTFSPGYWSSHSHSVFGFLNGAYWTLSIELLWYLLVPLVARLSNFKLALLAVASWGWSLMIDAGGYLGVFKRLIQQYHIPIEYGDLLSYLDSHLPGTFCFFAVGVLMYRLQRHPWGQRLQDRIRGLNIWVVRTLIVATVVPIGLVNTPSTTLRTTLILIGASLVFLLALHTAVKPSWLTGVGIISYSLYLWHYPVLVIAREAGLINYLPFPVVITVCYLLIAVISLLSYFLIEQGGLAIRDRVKARLAQARNQHVNPQVSS